MTSSGAHTLKKVIGKLERVQKRATQMIQNLENLPYSEILKKCNLFNLPKRKLRDDLITIYKGDTFLREITMGKNILILEGLLI